MGIEGTRGRTVAFMVVSCLVLLLFGSSPAAPQDPGSRARLIAEGVRARLEFGLPATPESVGNLLGSISDVGSSV